jgi:hypothetical protein
VAAEIKTLPPLPPNCARVFWKTLKPMLGPAATEAISGGVVGALVGSCGESVAGSGGRSPNFSFFSTGC